ncbi:hypothetical protein ABZP36_031094 [Zizania latifolia]
MGTERGGVKVGGGGGGGGGGGLFNLFDWKRKSRKKLFSNLPGSCASSVTDEEGREIKAPGVVARLMGLDAMPSTGVPETYCTPFQDTRSFRDSHNLKRSSEYSGNDQFSYVPRRIDGYMRKPMDLRAQKMPSSPIERFQLEALPPSSARNAAQIMEAAAMVLEPRPQVNSREKICSYSPARIPLRVSKAREHIPSSQRAVSRQLQSSRTPVELPDVRFSMGQQMNQSWNSEAYGICPAFSIGKKRKKDTEAKNKKKTNNPDSDLDAGPLARV